MITHKQSDFTHLDAQGNANMVDVSDKSITKRTAIAQAIVQFPEHVYLNIKATSGNTKKGAITDISRIAGIMGGKKTSDLIPLCHPLPLDKIAVDFINNDDQHSIEIQATAQVTHTTGVEMEAMTAVTVASLTIYDMCKAQSHDIYITDIRLLEKTGGKQNFMRD